MWDTLHKYIMRIFCPCICQGTLLMAFYAKNSIKYLNAHDFVFNFLSQILQPPFPSYACDSKDY